MNKKLIILGLIGLSFNTFAEASTSKLTIYTDDVVTCTSSSASGAQIEGCDNSVENNIQILTFQGSEGWEEGIMLEVPGPSKNAVTFNIDFASDGTLTMPGGCKFKKPYGSCSSIQGGNGAYTLQITLAK